MILNSWKDIANYVGACVRTVKYWHYNLAKLPLQRMTPNQRSHIWVTEQALLIWLDEIKSQAPRSYANQNLKNTVK